MDVDCKLYGPPREALGRKRATVPIEDDATVGDVLDALVAEAPDLGSLLFTTEGDLPGTIGVLVNGTNVTRERGLATPVESGDEVLIAPPVHGG